MPDNIRKLPYAEWLEHCLQELITFPVKGIAIFATSENGTVYNNYHELSMADKLVVAGLIQQDAMLETMQVNGLIESIDDSETEEADGETS